MRELFIYYRIPLAKAEAARVAVEDFQARLRARHPGLRARLLRRPEHENNLQTWMETYAFDPTHDAAGVSAACESDIAFEARGLADFIEGSRHVEGFVACAS
jgi:hypothetical protein